MLRKLVLIGMATTAAACGGGGSGESSSAPAASAAPSAPVAPQSPPRLYPQSDEEVAQRVYSTDQRTPADFYSEPTPGSASYVATAHLKSIDLDSTATARELCTDDWNQALAWSETAATRRAVYADLVATNSEPRFFEFERVPRDAPTALVRQRVFRCGYLDRASADPAGLEGAGGQLNRRPLAAAQVRELAEYLWHFTLFNNFGNAVLESAPAGELAHGLTVATLIRAGTPESCDRIEVKRWTHTVDATTGAITRTLATLATLHARATQGQVSLCAAS